MEQLNVLVVEDELIIQIEIEETLREAGFLVHCETAGEAAIERLQAEPKFRALITDVNLKGSKTGWDVARRARESSPDLPVVYLTSVSSEEWASKGVPKSVLISKPFAPAQIVTALSQLLNGSVPSE